MKKTPTYSSKNQVYKNLENFQSIDLDQDWSKVKDRIGFRKERRIAPLWRAAAVLLLLLGIGYLLQHYVLAPTELMGATTGPEQKQVLLPDGSRVHLNKFSALTYPEKFKRNQREVSISGEGYFEVTRDPNKTFIVNVAEKAFVEVLGTSFNIKVREDNGSLSVQVVEGKVAFYLHGNESAQKVLLKDDQAIMREGTITLNSQKDLNFLSWKTGKLYFNQTGIKRVAEILSSHYNREISIDSSVDRGLTFTSTIDNQELESVLEELALVLGISYEMENQRIVIQNRD